MAFDYFIYYGWRIYAWPVVLTVSGLLLLILIFNFLRYSRIKPKRPSASPVAVTDEAAAEVAKSLGKLVACKTVWRGGDSQEEKDAFDELHNMLKNLYPGVHRVMKRVVVDEYSVIFRWKGEGNRRPVLFCGHFDVRDADERWSVPPFEGRVTDDFVYGRGVFNCKGRVTALLLAAESLINSDFTPQCDIYFAFAHDGLTSENAAERLAKYFKEQGVTFEAVFDEGGRIDMEVDFVQNPVAFVCVTEKSILNVKLTARGMGSSTAEPPDHSAVGVLAEAVGRLEYAKFPLQMTGIMRRAIRSLAPYMTAGARMVVSNKWMFRGALNHHIRKHNDLSSLFRTTLSVTTVRGGESDKELPVEAYATLNVRLMPDDDRKDVEAYLRAVLKGLNIDFEMTSESDQPLTADTDSRLYHVIETSVYECFGSIPVVPFLQTGCSAGRYFEGLCRNIFRFSPIPLTKDDRARAMGVDERIRVKSLGRSVEFYRLLYRNISAGKTEADSWEKQ